VLLLALLFNRSGSPWFCASAKAVLLTWKASETLLPLPKWRTLTCTRGQSTPAVHTGRDVIVQPLSDTLLPEGDSAQLPQVALPATVPTL